MIKKVMISQPMAGKTEEEIEEVRAKATEYLKSKGYEIVNTYFPTDNHLQTYWKSMGIKHEPIWLLGGTIHCMAYCNIVFFCKGWEQARGCRIEHEVAKAYGLDIIYEI